MTLISADRDSARVTAVIHSLDETALASPSVESVSVEGDRAAVRLIGRDGERQTVRLRKDAGRWHVTEVQAA